MDLMVLYDILYGNDVETLLNHHNFTRQPKSMHILFKHEGDSGGVFWLESYEFVPHDQTNKEFYINVLRSLGNAVHREWPDGEEIIVGYCSMQASFSNYKQDWGKYSTTAPSHLKIYSIKHYINGRNINRENNWKNCQRKRLLWKGQTSIKV